MHAAIVGGGIVGLASAYYLRQRGVDATVFERDRIGAGSTPRAGGGIREQFSTPVSIALSRESVTVWKRFEEEFGVDIDYRRSGYLYLARTEETAERIRDLTALHAEHDVPSEFVASEEAVERCPELRADRYVGATYCPTDGFADPERALQGFALGAARAGAEVRVGAPVTDVVREGDRVAGVETPDGRVEADYVVNAAGAWAPAVASMAGLDLPIVAERRQLLVVGSKVPLSVPFTIDLDTGSYLRPHGEGAYIGGRFDERDVVDPDAFDPTYDDDWADEARERAADCTRYVAPDARIKRGWAGLYAMTPDHHPIVEETVSGFVTAAGFSGHGFMQSPAAGRVVAELIADGEASAVDVSALAADRFERGEALHETFYSA